MIGGIDMPNIKPISDLRNYTAVINEVAYGNRVYLTRDPRDHSRFHETPRVLHNLCTSIRSLCSTKPGLHYIFTTNMRRAE